MQRLLPALMVAVGVSCVAGDSSCSVKEHVALVQRQASLQSKVSDDLRASTAAMAVDHWYLSEGGQNCDDACQASGYVCDADGFPNDQTSTEHVASVLGVVCPKWFANGGTDAPFSIADGSPQAGCYHPYTTGATCSYVYGDRRLRFCPCKPATGSPTASPTASPTTSPTGLPTSPMATAVGDPHLVNTRGDHFSIFKSGQVEFIRVPYESVTEEADLTVHATIQSFGETDKCKEALYITGLRFDGSWFKGKPLEINFDFIRPGATKKEMNVLLGSVPVVPSTDPIDVGDKMALHMQDNKQIVLMVDGASVVVDQRRTAGRGFLNVKADSFSKLSQKIGGLLGEDDHSAFSTKPAGCEHELVAETAQPVYTSASMSA